MRVLRDVAPTPQQLTLIDDAKPGVLVIRGAAGSGKTTTALLRLRSLVGFWQRRQRDGYVTGDIRVLVLTYNKTLRGYLASLAKDMTDEDGVHLVIKNFDQWTNSCLGNPNKVSGNGRLVSALVAQGLPASSFMLNEVEYVQGLWLPENRAEYLKAERKGRGTSPRMEAARRQKLLDALDTYDKSKAANDLCDWNDLAVALATMQSDKPFHIVIVDEAQDFSANQLRAVLNHLHDEHSLTFVTDQAQRIYPRRFNWSDVNLTVSSANSKLLERNFRNTVEIAAFAAPLLTGLDLSDEGAMPNFQGCTRNGPKPVVVTGRFTRQMDYFLKYLDEIIAKDPGAAVAVLHPKGHGYFTETKARLAAAGVEYVEITGSSYWPEGDENVALSTMKSAKGLEFDHVAILGLNQETTPHGSEDGDAQYEEQCRQLAMAIGRARESVLLGYKSGEQSNLIALLDPSTFTLATR